MARARRVISKPHKKGVKATKRTTPRNKVRLATKLSVPADSLWDYSQLVYGEKKVGKTSLYAQVEGAQFLMTEPGGKSLAILQNTVRDWEDFKEYISQCIEADEVGAGPVVIDTADLAYKMCFDFMLKKLMIEHPHDENDYGKSWGQIKDEFMRQVARLLRLQRGIVFTSHSREEETQTRAGRKFHRLQPTMPNQARDILEGVVDLWAYYGYRGKRRVLQLRGDEFVSAGCRMEGRFLYTNGRQIIRLNMGNSAEEACENFMRAFDNEVKQKKKG